MRSIAICCHSVWGVSNITLTRNNQHISCLVSRLVVSTPGLCMWPELYSTIQKKRVLTLLVTLAKSYKYVAHKSGTSLVKMVLPKPVVVMSFSCRNSYHNEDYSWIYWWLKRSNSSVLLLLATCFEAPSPTKQRTVRMRLWCLSSPRSQGVRTRCHERNVDFFKVIC